MICQLRPDLRRHSFGKAIGMNTLVKDVQFILDPGFRKRQRQLHGLPCGNHPVTCGMPEQSGRRIGVYTVFRRQGGTLFGARRAIVGNGSKVKILYCVADDCAWLLVLDAF